MFVSDRLIYLQLQKTGCTHITQLLRECIGGEEGTKHGRLHDDPEGRFVLGSVRNPWSWYLSLWAYGCAGGGGFRRRVSIRSLRRGYHLSKLPRQLGLPGPPMPVTLVSMAHNLFKPTARWREAYADSEDPACFRKWLELLFEPARRYDFGEGFGYTPLVGYAGLLTYRYARLFWRSTAPLFGAEAPTDLEGLRRLDEGQNLLDYTVRTENLEEDLLAALDAAGLAPSAEQQAGILEGRRRKTNASSHRGVEHYYDADMVTWVGEREQFIIDRYGYTAPAV